jgi:F-type H+-transporting ATPase subunit delta
LSISAVSRRYAKALVSLGAEQQKVEDYGKELSRVASVFAAEGRLRQILESPTYPLAKKADILSELTRTLGLSAGVAKFLRLLLEKDRLRFFPQIESDYRKLADDLSGILRARIISAATLDQNQRQAMKAGLEKQTGKKVELQVQVDPALIGGVRVEIGGKVFDSSLKTQLNRIEDTIKKG